MEQDHERTADAFTLEETYAATRRPVELAETLPPEAYASERFFALERARVFASSWVAVGCTAELREPGDVLVSDVAGRSISSSAPGTGSCARSTTPAAIAARGC